MKHIIVIEQDFTGEWYLTLTILGKVVKMLNVYGDQPLHLSLFFLTRLLSLMVMFFLFAKLMVMVLLQLLCKNLGDICLQMLVPWISICLQLSLQLLI